MLSSLSKEKFRSVTGVHVDDFLGGGDEVFDRDTLDVKCESILVLGMSEP